MADVTVGKKNVIIPAQYNHLFPSGKCDLLQSETAMAFIDNPNGRFRLYKNNGNTSTLIIQSTFVSRAIMDFFKLKPLNRAAIKTHEQDRAVIIGR